MFFPGSTPGHNLSQTDLAYRYLLDKILSCEYLPGQEISEKMLNEELSFGRTPIREALLALKSQNLVKVYPRRGMHIRPFTRKYINEIYQIRKIIEPTVITQFKGSYSKSVLLDMQADMENSGDMDNASFYQKDIRFHMYFIEQAKNDELISFYENLMVETYRLAMYAAVHKRSIREENLPQHAKIIRALITENNDQIAIAVNEHINHSLVTLIRVLDLIEGPDNESSPRPQTLKEKVL